MKQNRYDNELEIYAFFSPEIHKTTGGRTTTIGFRSYDRRVVKANWIGPSIEGYPGLLGQNAVIRPPHYKSYIYLGALRTDDLRFPCRNNADVRKCFSVNAMTLA